MYFSKYIYIYTHLYLNTLSYKPLNGDVRIKNKVRAQRKQMFMSSKLQLENKISFGVPLYRRVLMYFYCTFQKSQKKSLRMFSPQRNNQCVKSTPAPFTYKMMEWLALRVCILDSHTGLNPEGPTLRLITYSHIHKLSIFCSVGPHSHFALVCDLHSQSQCRMLVWKRMNDRYGSA